MTILLVIVILAVLVITHELGHFLAAKLSGVKVQEFGVGYPPRAFTFGTFGGTEYTLNWIPFGGFVRLFGDEGEGERGRGSFVLASRAKQALILSAGIVMNIFLGWALLSLALSLGIPRAVSAPGPGVQLLISDVVAASPAETAGLKPGDRIVDIADSAGKTVALTPGSIHDFIAARGGEHLGIVYVRNGATSTALAIPANAVIPGAAGAPALGIGLVLVSSQPVSWSEAMADAVPGTWNAFGRVAGNVWGIITRQIGLGGVIGPVGLVSVVGEAAQTGVAQVIALAAFISVNLAVINLIPIPALDGGRLVIVAAEALLRRPVSKLAVHLLNFVGITAILFLMVVVTWHDVSRLVV